MVPTLGGFGFFHAHWNQPSRRLRCDVALLLGFMLDSGDVAEEAQANSAPTCLRVSLILGLEVHLFVTSVLIDNFLTFDPSWMIENWGENLNISEEL